MAATKRNAMLIEEAREKIKTTQLINRLQDHALSETEIMTPSQVRSVEILLKKRVPDLQSVTIGGDEESPVRLTHRIERVIVDTQNSDSESVSPASEAIEI